MKSTSIDQIVGIPSSSPQPLSAVLHSGSHGLFKSKRNKLTKVLNCMSTFRNKAKSYTKGIKEHGREANALFEYVLKELIKSYSIYLAVSLGPNIPETLKGKLSLGKRILQAGGVERVFGRNFSIAEGEKLLKAFQCYLSTTAGPISGLLFISNEKIAFQSDKHLILTSPKGDVAKIPYKVIIPLRRMKTANSSEDVNEPKKKYIQIVTVDGFEFWFMGFLSYNKSFKCLQQATLDSQREGRDIVLGIPTSSIGKMSNNYKIKKY